MIADATELHVDLVDVKSLRLRPLRLKLARTPRVHACPTPELCVHLTRSDLDVIEGITEGLTSAQIAFRLGLAHSTVKNRLHDLQERLGLVSRTQLAVLALRSGWLTPASDQSTTTRRTKERGS